MLETQQRLIRCFAAVFPGLNEDEITRASTSTVASWDSVGTATLIAVIEEEFGRPIAPEDFARFGSFTDAHDYLRDLHSAT